MIISLPCKNRIVEWKKDANFTAGPVSTSAAIDRWCRLIKQEREGTQQRKRKDGTLGSALADVAKRARLWEGDAARPPEKETACEGRPALRRERSGEGAALEARRDRCPAERATACKQHERVRQAIEGLGDGGQRGGGEEGPLGLRGWRRRWQPPPPLQGMGMERRRF